jgi:phosphopantetheinyl transferase (holo-ACP synthase)
MTVDKGFFPSGTCLPVRQGREMGNMGSLGNDIIDWQLAKTQIQKLRPRSLEKVCTPEEIEIIINDKDQLKCFWKIWAAKETAYKSWQRYTYSKPVFNPSQFSCSFLNENAILVKTPSFDITIHLDVTPDYIHAFVDSKEYFNQIYTKTEHVHFLSELSSNNLVIRKSEFNIPLMEHTKTKKTSVISISHDGRFYAISYPSSLQQIMSQE